MCFFNQTVWACQHWRWGPFRHQCNKENHIGETCGLKLIWETNRKGDFCKTCKLVKTKERRIKKTSQRLEWLKKQGNYPVSVESTENELSELRGALQILVAYQGEANPVEFTIDYEAVLAACRPNLPIGLHASYVGNRVSPEFIRHQQ